VQLDIKRKIKSLLLEFAEAEMGGFLTSVELGDTSKGIKITFPLYVPKSVNTEAPHRDFVQLDFPKEHFDAESPINHQTTIFELLHKFGKFAHGVGTVERIRSTFRHLKVRTVGDISRISTHEFGNSYNVGASTQMDLHRILVAAGLPPLKDL
jgi:hypothetical protein